MAIDTSINEDAQRTTGITAKFDTIGDVRRVVVKEARKRQATDYVSGALSFWDDGSPKEQVIISGTDPETGDEVAIFIKWWGAMKRAYVAAMEGHNLEVGGTFAMKWIGEEPPSRAGMSPTKLWKMQYTPPVATTAIDDII